MEAGEYRSGSGTARKIQNLKSASEIAGFWKT